MNTIRDVFQERLEEFRANYSFTEQDELIRTLAVTGELLDLMFVRSEAALAMTALRKIIAHGTRQEWKWADLDKSEAEKDWRKTWEDIDGWDASSTPPFLDELHELNAFGNFGILPAWEFVSINDLKKPEAAHLRTRLEALRNIPGWVEAICQKIDHFERLAPRNADGSTSLDALLETRDRARARIKYDLGHSVTIHDLALLSGVSVKRVQNAIYAKTDEAPIVDKNGLISPESCEAWLAGRDYMRSIWKQVSELYPLQEDWGRGVQFGESEQGISVEDFVFVPVANDGTMFTPSLRRETDKKYLVGPKGDERSFDIFKDALSELQKMETPRWRRPNRESGKAGIVTGQVWKRVRESELAGL